MREKPVGATPINDQGFQKYNPNPVLRQKGSFSMKLCGTQAGITSNVNLVSHAP